MDNVLTIVKAANVLLDRGTLTKMDEHLVSALLRKHDLGHHLDGAEVSRLRELIERNGE